MVLHVKRVRLEVQRHNRDREVTGSGFIYCTQNRSTSGCAAETGQSPCVRA